MSRRWIRWVALACAGAWLGCGGEEDDGSRVIESESTREIMRRFAADLRVVLPYSVDDATFAESVANPAVRQALADLADNAAVLVSHSRRNETGTRQLGRSLERDTSEILRQYDRGHVDRAAFLLHQVTENCVVCHSRRPDLEDSEFARNFVDGAVLEELDPERRVTLEIATRQFDAALATLEGLLTDPYTHAAMMQGPLTDYLTINLRVKDDYTRPIAVLQKFARRDDLWQRLRKDVGIWIDALPGLDAQTRGEPELATARKILAEGARLREDPDDLRSDLVHRIAASAVLQRYVRAHRDPGPELAEAYFLLGQTEARIGRNYWVSQAQHFLATAIRIAPGSPIAREAYGSLEEEILMSDEGSYEDAPAREDAALLAALQALMDAS